MFAPATNATSLQLSVTPAAASVSNGSSTSACASSSAVGLRALHFTSRSVTSDGRTSSFSWDTQRAINLETVCCRSTSSTSA